MIVSDIPKHECEVVHLPIDWELWFARVTARALERMSGDAANRFFRMQCNRLLGRLQVQGVDPKDIPNEIQKFTWLVQSEIEHAFYAEKQKRGAA